MTLIDVISALLILSIFFIGLSQAFMPVCRAWDRAMTEYRTARTIHFIARSFRDECAKPEKNIENWERNVSIAKELERYEISELRQGGILRALKLSCVISGERFEIIGVCAP